MPAWVYSLLSRLIDVFPPADVSAFQTLSSGWCQAWSAVSASGRLLCGIVDCDILNVCLAFIFGVEGFVILVRLVVWIYKLLPFT